MPPTKVSQICERPIQFAAPMVQALLSGRKTQTRRIITPQPDLVGRDETGRAVVIRQGRKFFCPFGQAGDRLWVRERSGQPRGANAGPVVYAADPDSSKLPGIAWRQSWLMPRSASRILLQITATRTESLQDISSEDAKAEGFDPKFAADPIAWFRQLWDSLSAARGFGWETNPQLWVVSFKIHKVTR